jgi:hypothetical protein
MAPYGLFSNEGRLAARGRARQKDCLLSLSRIPGVLADSHGWGPVEQGGTNEHFVTNQNGELLMCLNNSDPSGNLGGWQIEFFVDESQAQ